MGWRRINPVSVAIVLVLVTAVFLGVKLIPPYYQAHQVEHALTAYRDEGSQISQYDADPREQRLLDEAYEAVRGLGVDDPYLDVYFAADYSSIHADYTVEVDLLVTTVELEFRESQSIPRN